MIWTTRQASDGAGRVAARVAGQGPDMLLVHGVGLSGQAMLPLGAALAEHFSVHVLDMPGHGASPLAGAATLSDFADRIAGYAARLGGAVHLAGHSMGAMVVLEMARRGVEVSSLTALNAIHARSAAAAQAVRARAAALPVDAVADPGPTLARWFGTAPDGPRAAQAAACRAWLTEADPAGYKAAYTIFASEDGPREADLAQLDAPALFLTGAQDANSTPAMSRRMAGLCPDGRARVLDDAGHMLPLTHAEMAAAEIRALAFGEGRA